MKCKIMIICTILTAIFQTAGHAKLPGNEFMRIETIPSPAIEGNMLEDKAEQEIVILLPPSYNKTQKRYPVVYYLHGYSGAPEELLTYRESLFEGMKEGNIKEFIMVAVNGNNSLMGSFYVNSVVTGNWEDSIIKEIIPYVDRKYRAIPSTDARGITGFSMGGFGAINLALRHPDVFSAVLAVGPGLFDKNGLKDALSSGQWDNGFRQAYGAAFAPNPKKAHPYADMPDIDGTTSENKAILEKWENGFGNLEQKIKEYLSRKDKLKAIRIVYGNGDSYAWIVKGCAYFSALLKKNNIKHEIHSFDGGHTLTYDTMVGDIAPFFSNHLKFE